MTQTWIYIGFIILLISSLEKHTNISTLMDEICDNAIDDDDDGLIDINDPDCICEIVSLESLFPNPSFEDYNCCPETDSQLSCAEGWDQASGGTTDYLNTCDYIVVEEMLPFPDGEGAVLFLNGTVDNGNGSEIYKEYAGACLNSTMQKDSVYKFKFHLGFLDEVSSPEIFFSFFGSSSCNNLPFSPYTDCPSNYPEWQFIKSEIVNGDGVAPGWVEVSTVIQPSFDINALVIGGNCSGDSEGMLRIYFIDNLRLSDEDDFDFELLEHGSPCDSNFTFAVAQKSNFSYQWYKEGIALIDETDAELSQMYGEGFYQLRIINPNTQQCRIAEDFEFIIPVFANEIFRTICEGESLLYQGDVIEDTGIYNYTLTSVDGCDSTVTLNVEMQLDQTDTVYAQTLPGATYSIGGSQFTDVGEYQINLISSNGCDSSIVLFLKNINVYIPNAFSPNGDGNNDYFEVFTSDDEVIMKEISIFDRWGNLLYVGKKWDGRADNKIVDPGVYVYLIRLIDATGKELTYSNSITLVK